MSWTELITLVLMDAWRTVTGRNRERDVDWSFLDEEEERQERENRENRRP